MKRIFVLILTVAVALTMVGCAEKVVTFNIDGASKILLMSGSSGETVEITDPETIAYITDNINSMTFNRDESSRQHNDWSYSLRWYDSEDNLIEYIVIMSATRIDYDNYFYNEMDADVEIDIAYLEELLSGELGIEDAESVVDDGELLSGEPEGEDVAADEVDDAEDTAEEEYPDVPEPEETVKVYYLEYYTFDDVILNSNVAIVGEYVETISHDNYTEQKFIVKDVLYGNVPDEEIYLYANSGIAEVTEIDYTYELGADIYTVGMEYILVMEKLESVFYDHDRYMVSADILLCEENDTYIIYSEPIPVTDSIRDYIISVYNSAEHGEVIETVYENDIEELISESKFIGVVNIEGLEVEGTVQNSNTYRCTVETLYMGENLNTYSDGTILLSLKKNTVEVGESYVIGFTSSSDTSLIYSQSASDAVFELDDERVSEIEDYLSAE
ncbi:MAG: hypothetical protein LIO49_08055 [Ruminococcus sp.]|nr:hypothetical protein [Ruminococcus sp.]